MKKIHLGIIPEREASMQENIIIIHENFLELRGFDNICTYGIGRIAFLSDKSGYVKNIAVYPGKKENLPLCEFEFNIVFQNGIPVIDDGLLTDCICQQLFIHPGDFISFWSNPDGTYISKTKNRET